VHWESSGYAALDILSIATRPSWLERQVASVVLAIEDTDPSVIVAHSCGAVLAAAALRRIRVDLPLICIGSPIGHPVYGAAFASIGLRGAVGGAQCVDIWNADDPVACSPILGRSNTSALGWDSRRIAVAGVARWVAEHADRHYLTHHATRMAVMEAMCSSRRSSRS
jgi:alpha-beta hydrolase superfamily lysophospholipase